MAPHLEGVDPDPAHQADVERVGGGPPHARSPLELAEAVLSRPRLRGWSHLLAFAVAGLLGMIMLALTDAPPRHRLLIVLYLVCMLTMFGASAMYHRGRWTVSELVWLRRIDHSTIFLAIAGSYTPIAVAAFDGRRLTLTLLVAWIGAAVGIALQVLPIHLPRVVFSLVYVVVGWSLLPSIVQLYDGLGPTGFTLVLGGGVAYTVGAVVYAAKRPDPWPDTFGFHEVFHLLTVVGGGSHLAAVAFFALPRL